MFDERTLGELQGLTKKWERKHRGRFSQERKSAEEFVCDSGIPVNRVYTPLDLEEKGIDYSKDLGLPGEYPYVRGITPTGYRETLWDVEQYAGHATPRESNALWKRAVSAGAGAISIAYDLPTQLGYDPDDPRAEGEVARVGVSLVSLRDWEVAFEGIDITRVVVSQVANAMAAMAIANHLCLAQEQSADLPTLRGRCQNDILKEYLVRGNYIFPPEPSVRLTADTLAYCAKEMPSYHPIQVCSAHYSESQATPVHDAAFALADAFCYLRAAVERGVDVDLIAAHMEILVGHEHYGFFQEIAKLRAMRKVWARVLRDTFKARRPQSLMCRLCCAQGGNSLQRQQYLNNIARSTLATLVAALGGARLIQLRTYDEQFGIPTAEAHATSIRIQHVVAQETGVTDTVDPLGGSYFLECLTSEFEERISKELETIDRLGGVIECINSGHMKRVVMQDAYQWQRDFEAGRVIRVGANFFTSAEGEEERPTTIYRADPQVERERIEAVRLLRRKRDNRRVRKVLEEVRATAALPGTAQNNLMPPIVEAVQSYATVGEMCNTLREVWGEHRESMTF